MAQKKFLAGTLESKTKESQETPLVSAWCQSRSVSMRPLGKETVDGGPAILPDAGGDVVLHEQAAALG